MSANKGKSQKMFRDLKVREMLKAFRLEEGLTKDELADAIFISVDRYTFFEKEYDNEITTDRSLNIAYEKIYDYFKDEPALRNAFVIKNSNEKELQKTPLALSIIRQRKKLHDSEEDLAAVLQVGVESVYSWESGERIPRKPCADRIMEYLEIKPEMFKKT